MEEQKPLAINIDPFVESIQRFKEAKKYDEMSFSEKMSFKATLQLELTYLVNHAIGASLPETPEYEPMSLGQLSIDMIHNVFPETVELMNFNWIPWILSPESVHGFDIRLSNKQYEYLREFAKRTLESEEPISDANREHLERIANGVMPENVLSPDHSRWEIRDALTNEIKNRTAVQKFKEEQSIKK